MGWMVGAGLSPGSRVRREAPCSPQALEGDFLFADPFAAASLARRSLPNCQI